MTASCLDGLLELFFRLGELFFECSEDRLDAPDNRLGRSRAQTVLLGGAHLQKLTPARYKCRKCLLLLRRQRADLRTDALCKEREHARVNLVGLCQASGRFGEVAGLPRVHQRHRQTGGGQRSGDPAFVAAGSLQDNPLEALPSIGFGEAVGQLVNARWRVVEAGMRVLFVGVSERQIQVILCHVNASESHKHMKLRERAYQHPKRPCLVDANSKPGGNAFGGFGSGNGSGSAVGKRGRRSSSPAASLQKALRGPRGGELPPPIL